MNWFNAVAVGLLEILANKFRSLLTMLGIILGVSSLVAMSALTKGMENGMKEALIAIGGLEKVRIRIRTSRYGSSTWPTRPWAIRWRTCMRSSTARRS